MNHFKKDVFADVLSDVTPVNSWKSLKYLESEIVEVIISLLSAIASDSVERTFSFGLIHCRFEKFLGP